MKTAEKNWVVYLLRCRDGSLYCGVTNHLENRLKQHNSGRGAKYTRSRRPVELAGVSPGMTKSTALTLEYRVKQVPASQKISELSKGAPGTFQTLCKDLSAVAREIDALAEKIETITAALARRYKWSDS